MNQPVINLSDVAIDLGGRPVLRNVNLQVLPGEYLGLLGPNGAGKTTLLRTMMGILSPLQGTVRLGGNDPRKTNQMVGYVPQRHEFAWDFPITVEGVVMSGRTKQIGWFKSPNQQDYAFVHQALKRVKMGDLSQRTVGELSGGQRQRVLIARALATNLKVLLLDEPFTGVDMPTQELLLTLIDDLVAEGIAVVMTTHDIASALVTCHQLALINQTVIAKGTRQELKEETLWATTFGVTAASPLLASVKTLTSVPEIQPEEKEGATC